MKDKILILGGYSNKNIPWINKMKEIFNKDYDTYILEYEHWHSNNELDIEKEISNISKIINENNIDIVIAKSIGIVLVSMAIEKKLISPKKVVFLGYPKKVLDEENIDILSNILEKKDEADIIFIQQENDFQCSYEKLLELLDGKIKVFKIDGDDHSYNDIESIKMVADEFLK